MEGIRLCGQRHLQPEAPRASWKNPTRKTQPRLGRTTEALVQSIGKGEEESGFTEVARMDEGNLFVKSIG